MSTARRSVSHSLLSLDPATYTPHALHDRGRSYLESNCYTDIIIELLHARGDEPLAALGFLVRMDFEGDQWTFFKPSPEDLDTLFGVDIHEMQPYRALPVQIAEQLASGRTMIVELDAWFLPDTAATSYRTEHVKSSVAAEGIDLERGVLRYFHGPGLFELSGEDFEGIFGIGRGDEHVILPPYTELVRFGAGPRLRGDTLREAARALLRAHLARRPHDDPFARFGEQLARTLPDLLEGDLGDYHAYAFATVRMAGAAFELASSHVDWLLGDQAAAASAAMADIVTGCKALGFRLARRRPFDLEPSIVSLGTAWRSAMDALEEASSA